MHQPHFLPWFPYMARLAVSEYYVVLDDVQFRRRFYHNGTVLVKSKDRPFRLTTPVTLGTEGTIADAVIKSDLHELIRIKKTIFYNYKKSPHFEEIWPKLASLLDLSWGDGSLKKLNVSLLTGLLEMMQLKAPKIIYSSEVTRSPGRDERIYKVCEELAITNVLCGWGMSTQIHSEEMLKKNHIKMYPLKKSFIDLTLPNYILYDGLSIVDTLMQFGSEATRKAVESIRGFYIKEIQK